MVTAPVLFDTCILIDYLRGIAEARTECGRHADRAISVITWMEVMADAPASNQDDTRMFLRNFHLVSLTAEIAERAVGIRRTMKIKLPDAIILATAEVEGRVFITRDTRDFPASAPGIRVPYTV